MGRAASAPVQGTLARRQRASAARINVVSSRGRLVEGTNDASFTMASRGCWAGRAGRR